MAKFTKQAICASFLNFLVQKPLEQITVKDIVDDCGINRKTFYYYYQDIHALANDVFQLRIEQIKDELPPEDYSWRDALNAITEYLYEKEQFTFHVYKSLGYEKLSDILFDACMRYLPDFVRASAADLTLLDSDITLIATYNAITLAGVLTKWIRQGMKTIPKDTVDRFCAIMDGCARLSLENAARLNGQR